MITETVAIAYPTQGKPTPIPFASFIFEEEDF
jgi:hypothetical protein